MLPADSIRMKRKARTRDAILEAARACFGTLGYERATIRDIARTAGCSTGAFFSNWPGKAEVYVEIYGHAPVTPEQGRELLAALAGGTVPAWAADAIGALKRAA